MTIPGAPLPSFREVLSAVWPRVPALDAWAGDSGRAIVRTYLLGRQALAAGIREAVGERPAAVHIPDYICREALDGLRGTGWRLSFYPVQDDLRPEWTALDQAMTGRGASALVLVHYFGFPNDVAYARCLCARQGAVLVEDAAHVLRPGAAVGAGDVTVYSPRKLLPVPQGGLLVVKRAPRNEAGRTRAGRAVDGTPRWLAERAAQGVMLRLGLSWHRRWSVDEVQAARAPSGGEEMTPFIRRLLAVEGAALDRVMETRRRNYLRLLDRAGRWQHARPLFPHLPPGVCPYAFPVIVARDPAGFVARLRHQGIPAGRWPQLLPELPGDAAAHGPALRRAQTLVLLPIHQGLSTVQVDAVADAVDALHAG